MADYVPYLITASGVTLVFPSRTLTVDASHPNHKAVLKAIAAKEWDKLETLADIPAAMAIFSHGEVAVENGVVLYRGDELHNSLTERMLRMLSEGYPIEPMVKFLDNLMQNPSRTAVEELYTFLEKHRMPITEDGHFIAYKNVRHDYKDHHSGTKDYTPGNVVKEDRNKVDDNRERTCSYGLHFCSLEYLRCFHEHNSVTLIVKVNPRDVVSIPKDYNDSKGRCCEMEVLGVHSRYNSTSRVEYTEAPVVQSDGSNYSNDPAIVTLRIFGRALDQDGEVVEDVTEIEVDGKDLDYHGDDLDFVRYEMFHSFPSDSPLWGVDYDDIKITKVERV